MPGRATRATARQTTWQRSPRTGSRRITARPSLRLWSWNLSGGNSRPFQSLPELRQGPRVENVRGFEPASPCQIHRVLHEREIVRLMAVRREHETRAQLLGAGRERVG